MQNKSTIYTRQLQGRLSSNSLHSGNISHSSYTIIHSVWTIIILHRARLPWRHISTGFKILELRSGILALFTLKERWINMTLKYNNMPWSPYRGKQISKYISMVLLTIQSCSLVCLLTDKIVMTIYCHLKIHYTPAKV